METDTASAGVTVNGIADKKPTSCNASSTLRSIITPWAWFQPQLLDPRVAALIYWRDVRLSAVVLGATLAVLISLQFCSVISVLSNFSLLALIAAFGFRVYNTVKQAINKTGSDGHPLQEFISMDLSLNNDKVHSAADCFLAQFNCTVSYLQRVFLVQDFTESFKFGVYLYCMTYIGGWMNGLTILLLAVIAMFSLPKAYEMNKGQVDQYVALAKEQINMVVAKVKAVIPMGGAAAAAKDKEQ